MLGKTLALSSSLFFIAVSTTHAGLYIGGGVGSDTVDFKQSSHVYQLDNFNVINQAHLSGTGVFGTLFAGYAHLNNKFYLAGEINGDLSSTTSKSSNVELVHATVSSTHYKLKNSVGISALPGYQLSLNTLFYGRLGYENALFKSITSDVSLANISSHKGGFRYGLGVKQAVSERMALRLDYSRVQYGKVQFSTLDTLSTTIKDTTVSPRQQLVELGVVFNFG